MANRYILMLENDEHDRETTSTYFDTFKLPVEFLKFSTEVMPFLTGQQKNKALPALILLSMNSLPDTGLTVLTKIKMVDELKHIPVIILGENTQPDLIKLCYTHGANTFINKPFTNQLTDISIRSFIHYWFEVAELPVESRTGIPEKL